MAKCFACDRELGKNPALVDTRDDQLVNVGRECLKLIKAAGKNGYQPPKGGPRLWVLLTPTKRGQKMTVRVTSILHGLIRFVDTAGGYGELEDIGSIAEPKRIKVGTIIDIEAFNSPGGLIWVGIAPHYSNYGG